MSLSKPTMSAIRFGYGIRPGEDPADGADALLAQFEKAKGAELRFPVEGIDKRQRAIGEFTERFRSARTPDKAQRRQNVIPIRKEILELYSKDQHARLLQSAYSPYGFYERLATFWMNHFSISARKQPLTYLYVPLYEAEVIRPGMTGSFDALLRQAITHPAMVIYLDQASSNGPNSRRAKRSGKGLNENLGRELLELHTLGVNGGYTQQDVHDAALLLTGVTLDRQSGKVDFKPQFAEPGPLTFMGKTYGGKRRSIDDVYAMLDDLAAMPQTARHICRKLAVHFVSDTPPEPLVDTMVAAWASAGGNLTDVYSAMLQHPAAWDNPGEKARQPYDFVIAGLRALDVPEKAFAMPNRRNKADNADDAMPASPPPAINAMANDNAMRKTAQTATNDEDKDEMGNLKAEKRMLRLRPPLNQLTVGAVRKLGQPLWEPPSPAGFEEGFDAWISSSQLTGRIEWAQRVSARYTGQLDPDALLKATLREAARDDTITVVRQAPNRAAGAALVLASPEFNRR